VCFLQFTVYMLARLDCCRLLPLFLLAMVFVPMFYMTFISPQTAAGHVQLHNAGTGVSFVYCTYVYRHNKEKLSVVSVSCY